ncbi:MAG: L,D-transpeptidase [Acidimicrobiales bacterium]
MLGPASSTRRGSAILLLIAIGTTAACVGERPTLADDTEPPATTAVETTTTEPEPPAKVAQAKAESISVFDSESDPTPNEEITAAEATAAPDIPLVFLVRREQNSRLEVYLPTAPSGSTGWLRAEDVTVSKVTFRVEVSLSKHRLRVFDGEKTVLDEPASIGESERPDAGGTYYIKELLQPPDPDGPYGAYAYGLSGFSTSLSSFDEGSGIVGIHGTDDPDSVGTDVPTGSIGLENTAISRLVDDIGLPLGTPVEIVS